MINRQQASQLLLSLNLRYQKFCDIFFSFRYQSVTPAPVASKTFLTFPTSISIISVEASLSLSFYLSLFLSFFLSFSLSLFLSLNKNGQTPASFSFIFGLFKQNFDFYIKSMWKMSIRYMALGFEPHEHESYPLTTRPGLPPPFSIFSMFLSQNLANLGLFFVYFRFFKLQYNFTANKREKLFIYLDRK